MLIKSKFLIHPTLWLYVKFEFLLVCLLWKSSNIEEKERKDIACTCKRSEI